MRGCALLRPDPGGKEHLPDSRLDLDSSDDVTLTQTPAFTWPNEGQYTFQWTFDPNMEFNGNTSTFHQWT